MFGTHESTFNRILVAENFFQLKQIFADYQNISGHNMETAIKVKMLKYLYIYFSKNKYQLIILYCSFEEIF